MEMISRSFKTPTSAFLEYRGFVFFLDCDTDSHKWSVKEGVEFGISPVAFRGIIVIISRGTVGPSPEVR